MGKKTNPKKTVPRNKLTDQKKGKKNKDNKDKTVNTVLDDEQTVVSSAKSAVSTPVDAFVNRIFSRKDAVTELVREFRDEKRGNDFTKMTAFTANMEKNRYKDVGCLDNNRVQLTFGPSAYIHANYVSCNDTPKKFICCQAPLPTTIEDFWRMVLQDQCKCIVMLCNYMEKNVKKCAEYLPKSLAQPLALGSMTVTMLSTGLFPFQAKTATKIQRTEVEVVAGDKRHHVVHLHWLDWPDRGVPPADMAPIEVVRDIQKYQGSPVVVHCSAGIGRTGSFVLLDMLLVQFEAQLPWAPDLRNAMKELRKQRNNSVQTEHQYLYVHQVMLNFLRGQNMNRAEIVIRSFTRFTPVPKDLKDEEHVFASIAMYKDFLERVLSKWNESFTIQITTYGLVMHFTRHKDWGSVTTAAMPHESMIYTESFLCLRFFQLLQTMLRNNTTIVYHSLYTQQGRNLLADYCVHLLQLLGTAQGAQGGSLRRHKSMILAFWKSYEPRINERLSNLMTNGGEVSIDAPLSWKRVEQWRVWREIVQKKKGTQVTPTFRRPRVAAIKARAAAGKEREPCLPVDLFGQNGFSYPFTTPFRHTCLPRFTYARSSASIPTHVKIFFGELKRLLSTDLYVEGRYAKNAEREYTFCLTLYLEGWKWLVRRHGAPVFKKTSRVGEHGSDTKESLRAFEEEMSTCLWEGIVKALIMPSSAVDVVEKCQKVASKKIASKAAELMISLKALRAISGEATGDAVPIWEQPFWKAKANHCWRAAGFKIDGEEAAVEEEWPMGEIDVNANVEVEEDSESDDEDWEEPSRWKRNEDGVVKPVKKTDIEESSDLLSINAPKELCVLKKSFKLNMLPNNLSIYFRNICKFMEQVLLSTGMSLKLVHKMAEENQSEGISMSFVSEDNEEVFKMQCNNKQPKPGFHFILEEAFWRLKEANGLDPEIVPLLESEDSMKVVRLFSFTDRFLNDLMFQ